MRRYVYTEEELALLNAMHERPLDDGRRLTYAEWLERLGICGSGTRDGAIAGLADCYVGIFGDGKFITRSRHSCGSDQKESGVLLCLFRPPLSFPCGLRRLDGLDAGYGCLKLLDDPGIEAFAGNACRQIDLTMKLGRNPRHKLAREGLLGCLAARRAKGKIVID